ncbi:MAG: biotin--[acetyl-CoA-carboxylase] ligase [Deltaproteobacteria bacterium]|nr:biotin--[acetyl-CoA-carboxylase] ligase [Deltaproteobacteria bacterium]
MGDPLLADKPEPIWVPHLEWEAAIKERLGVSSGKWAVHCYKSVSSTMDVAQALTPEVKVGEHLLVVAERQSAGRGRRGRRWQDAAGGLCMTVAFSHRGPALAALPAFSLVAGLVIHEYFTGLGCRIGLKWPNDVWSADGRKLAGVLLEMVRGKKPALLVGLGVNLSAPPESVPESISISELCGRSLSVPQVAPELADRLAQAWSLFRVEGFEPFREGWMKAALFLGQQVKVWDGPLLRTGRFVGLGPQGSIEIEDQGVVHEVLSGDVTLVKGA